jgi:predicted tellurium resistance membrane protein TerC
METELSMIVARILAVFYIALGVGMINGQVNYKKLVDGFMKSPPLTYLAGFLLVLMGMPLVQYHNLWGYEWPILITIVSWAILIKGILLIAIPNSLSLLVHKTKMNPATLSYLVVLLGVIFGYFGFFV